MIEDTKSLAQYEPAAGKLKYPTNGVVGVIDESQALKLITSLKEASVPDSAIMVVPSDRRDDFDIPLTGGGLKGLIGRIAASSGGDTDLVNSLREDLQPGYVLVGVTVGEDESLRTKVSTSLQTHGATHVNYLSKESIETLDGSTNG